MILTIQTIQKALAKSKKQFCVVGAHKGGDSNENAID